MRISDLETISKPYGYPLFLLSPFETREPIAKLFYNLGLNEPLSVVPASVCQFLFRESICGLS